MITAFGQQQTLIPTRIYSDVSRIAPPMPRSIVMKRLADLQYKTKTVNTEDRDFVLHPIDYPSYLLPDDHVTFQAQGKTVRLVFSALPESASLPPKDPPLRQILLVTDAEGGNATEIPEIFLEPELVARLGRADAGNNTKISETFRFEDFPAPIWKAIIAIEDQHFLDHNGLDPRGLLRALWVNLKTLSLAQGGSTITQQLVKNLMARRSKNIFKKLNEIVLSLMLEARFDKEKILERYLNEVYLGQIGNYEIHGVAEGAKYFFGKRIDEINLAEIALLAGIIRGPFYYSPYTHLDRALERQKLVLQKMVETGQIADEERERAATLPIRIAAPQTAGNKAPYFTDYVKAELLRQLKDRLSEQEISDAGFRVYTTLDVEMNRAAQEAVTNGVESLEKSLKVPAHDRLEGALASVDHRTGFVRALVGGRSYQSSQFNRILNMKRQVGSTFKPVIYLSALMKGTDPRGAPYGPAYPVEDAPWTLIYDQKRQKWTPRNYTREFMGWIPMRTALAHSINTVAARLGVEVGIDLIADTTRKLGVESEIPKYPSLSLGVLELSPVELVRIYATLANRGVQNELSVIRGITTDEKRAYMRGAPGVRETLHAKYADWMTSFLQSVFSEGSAKPAEQMGFDFRSHGPAAGKTGTTSHHRDSWFAGYTTQLTTVVWVGFDVGQTLDEKGRTPARLSGAGSALPIWSTFMRQALQNHAPAAFPESEHLSLAEIDRYSGWASDGDCPDSQRIRDLYLKDSPPPEEPDCAKGWPPSIPETVSE